MAEPIKVLIACGEGPYRTGLATILAAEPDIAVVGEAGDCQEAVERAVELSPDVILVDIVLTRHDEREAMLKIIERVAARVVVLADSHRAEDVSRALACGAQGYMLKSVSGAEIVQAVRKAAAGESAVSPDIVAALAAGLRREAGGPRLTGRETEVFRLLGEGLSNREIADRLMVSVSTVRTYIYRIMEKLELKSRAEATACAGRLFSDYGYSTGELKAADIGSRGGPAAIPAMSVTEELWSIFKDSATDFFCIWDSELNLVDTSQSGIESFFPPGTKKEDLIGKNIVEFMPETERTGRYQDYLTVIKTGKSLIFEDISPHPSYGDRRFTVKAFKLGDGMGQIITDITGHRQAEAVETPDAGSVRDGSRSAVTGERKQATALFIGIEWSCKAEGAAELERLEELVRECLDIAAEMVRLHGGMVAWFTGRGLLALFGVPVSQEYAPQRAIHAALDIRESLREHTEQIMKRGIQIDTRIAINTGVVVVEKNEEGTDIRCIPVANTAELAIKLQDVAGTGTIVVSESTYRLTRDQCTFETLGEARMKADGEAVNIYQLLRVRDLKSKLDAAAMRGLSGFVGRRTEIEALRNIYEKAQSGAGQVIGIVGEAGMGKSRLVLELRTVLPAGDYTYLEGGCISYDGSVPYLPLLGILRSHFDIREGEVESAIKKKVKARVSKLDEGLTGILSPLYDVLSLKVADKGYLQLEPQQKKDRIYEAVRDLLIRESQKKPLIIAIEDLHWIDKTSEEFITYLISFLSNIPILLILLSRPEYIHQWSSMSYYSRIGVNQLSTVSSAELVRSMLRDGEVAPELLDIVTGRAEGNPLFIEEFTRTLLENGSIRKQDHQYVLSTKASNILVPDTIQGIIAARMDRLEDNIKRTMQVAAIIGRDFTYPLLQAVTQMGEELKSHLLELRGLEFIYEKSPFPEMEYVFKHALIQEVAYHSLLPKRRREFHQRVGQAIEDLYPDKLEEFYEVLANHYYRSDNAEKAYLYLKLAGDKTAGRYSNWEAFHFYREAISTLKKLPETEENRKREIDVLLSMESPMKLLAYPEDSLMILEEGERLAQGLGDLRSLAVLYSNLGLCHMFKGDSPQGIKYAEYCFEMAAKIEDMELMAPTAFNLCSSYSILGEFEKVMQVAPRVLALIEKTHAESNSFGVAFNFNIYAALSSYCGEAMGLMGNFEEGEALCEKGLSFVQQTDNLYSLGFAEIMYGLVYIAKGDGENAVDHLQKAAAYGEEGQIIPVMSLASGTLGWGYLLLGEIESARNHVDKGLHIQEDAGLSMLMSLNKIALSMVHFDSGDMESAQICAEEALKLAQDNDEKWALGKSRIFLGRVLGKADKSHCGQAEECILQGIKLCDEYKMRPSSSEGYLYLGELYADSGQREKALKNLKKAESEFREMGMDYWQRRTQEVLARVEG